MVKIQYVILVVLVLASMPIMVFYHYKNQLTSYEGSFKDTRLWKENAKSLKLTTNAFIKTTIKDEGKQLSLNKSPINTGFSINEYLKPIESTPSLVIRISHLNCSTCIENLLKIAKQKIPRKYQNKVVVLTDFPKTAYYDSYIKSAIRIDFPFRNLKIDDYSFESSQNNLPFMFIIDEDNKIRNILIHTKEDKRRTEFYLEAIINRYFRDAT